MSVSQVIMRLNGSLLCLNHTSSLTSTVPVCVYSSILVLGLIFNLLALVFFFGHTKSRSQTLVYMTNLALADVLLLLTLPLRIYHHLGLGVLPQWLCDGLGLVLKANMYGSIFLLTCICLDRCLALSLPMSARVQEARQKSRWVCVGIWTLTFGASLPIYLARRGLVSGGDCFDALPVYATELAVLLPTLTLGFGLPLLVMLLCSGALLHSVRQSAVAQTDLVDSRKIQRMIAASLLIFLLSFLPYHAALLLLHLAQKEVSCPLLVAYRYSLMVACLNTVLDPLAYYFTTDAFRRNMDMGPVRRMLLLSSHRIRIPNKDLRDS